MLLAAEAQQLQIEYFPHCHARGCQQNRYGSEDQYKQGLLQLLARSLHQDSTVYTVQ